MKVIYKNAKTETICTSFTDAKKFFGGREILATSLLARVNALAQADSLRDIVVQIPFRFHSLHGKRKGTYAIDVKSKADAWRIVLQPLDQNEEPYRFEGIDQICSIVRIVRIEEVSKHYE